MKWLYILGSLLVFWLLITGCQEDTIIPTERCEVTFADSSASHPKAAAFQSLIEDYQLRGLPGIVLLVQDQHGVWIGTAGHADIEKGEKMRPCTVSKVASETKLFVGTLTLLLVEDGVLDLEDKITTWLSEDFTSRIENAEVVTLRQLLNHTSGIYDLIKDQGFYLELLNNPNRRWEAEELLAHVYDKPAVFPAGEGVAYSNTNYLLISMIIEAATGESHAKLLRQRIFQPLGLNDTYYHWHDQLPNTVAQGYYDLYNSGEILNLSNYHTGSGNGYGGIYSNVRDVYTFIQALFAEKSILQPATMEQMLVYTNVQEGKNLRYGLGLQNDFTDRPPNQQAIGHRGRDFQYSADLFYFPEADMTYSLIVNYGTDAKTALQDVFFEFREAIVDEMFSD